MSSDQRTTDRLINPLRQLWDQARNRTNHLEIAVFSRQLALLMRSGVGLHQAFHLMSSQGFGPGMLRALARIKDDLSEGKSLSRALGRHPKIFSMLYLGLVKAGESTGSLDRTFELLADSAEKELKLQTRLRQAMAYPLVIFCLSMLLTALIVLHVLPTFVNGVFRQEELDLPLPTRILVWLTDFLSQPLVFTGLLVGATAGLLLGYSYMQTPQGRYQWQQFCLTSPILRDVTRSIIASRFCLVFANLLKCGIPIVAALNLVSSALGNYVVAQKLEVAEADLQDGCQVALALKDTGLFPGLVIEFLAIGEESGRIPELLGKLSSVYDEDIENAIEAYTSLIEPVMLGVLGLGIGLVIVSVFLPLYQLVDKL